MSTDNNICFICDENYVMPTRVAISSLKRHLRKAEGMEYNCHVFSFDLTEGSIASFTELSEQHFTVEVHLLDDTVYQEKMEQVHQRTHVTKSSLLKFDLPKLLPDCDKLLYVDSDIVFKNDISDIFSIDISDYYMAAIPEYWDYYDNLRYCWRKKLSELTTFNAGFMLYNVPKMLKEGIPEQFWQKKLSVTTTLMDQACINMVIGQNFYQLPIRYNFNPMFHASFNIPHFNKLYKTDYKSLQDLVDDVATIHYCCYGAKPWLFSGIAMGNHWIDEYLSLGYDPAALQLPVAPRRCVPEFCKITLDLRKGEHLLSRSLSYALFIISHFGYYRKLLRY